MVAKKKSRHKNKALVLCSRNNHYRVVKPVTREMDQRGWKITILRLELLGEALVRIERSISSLRKGKKIKQIDIKEQKNKKGLRAKFATIGTYMLSYLMKIGVFLKPTIIVVVTDAPLLERTLIFAGKRLGIPSIRLQVGLIGSKHDQCEFLVDKMAISGEVTKDVLTKVCNVDADKFFCKEEICGRLKLDTNKKIVVFTTENLSPKENTTLSRIVCKAMKDFSDAQLVIKVHPAEHDCSLYNNIARETEVDCVVVKDIDIHEILYISNLLITYFSATGLEAMILNKPLITLNPFIENDPINYAQSNATLKVQNEKELKDAIKMILYDEQIRKKLAKNRDTYVYKQAYKQDGKATKRVADLVEKMVR